jgi:hypothetical protein
MQQQLGRYFLGALVFAFVVAWATLGATTALAAATACLVAANLHRFAPRTRRVDRRPRRIRETPHPTITARPLDAEDDDEEFCELVPDDPSLIISTSY